LFNYFKKILNITNALFNKFAQQLNKTIFMKTNFKLAFVAFVAFTSFLTSSCSNDDDDSTPAVDNTITGIASRTSDLSSLVAALNRAGLASTLQTTGPFTVFAPTNAAFSSFLTANGYANLEAVPVAALKEILLNHVLNGENLSTSLTSGYVKTLGKGAASTTNTLSMYIKKTTIVRINGVATVTTADIDASNGVVHIVDAVIGLPTIVTHAVANDDFNTLEAALGYNPSSGFIGVLSGTTNSPFTVFAPTNEAFTAFLAEIGAGGLADIAPATLEKTLKYHVKTGANVLAGTLVNDQVINMFSGQDVTVKTSPTRLKDVSNRDCNIVNTDVQCSNGVIHVLSKVLLPTF
jgi:uncharacterized surface protein with fasciclin (FAS1) repeats